VLYQLSYTHHWFLRPPGGPGGNECSGSASVPVAAVPLEQTCEGQASTIGSGACMYFAAIPRAVSLSGPGCGTNSASR
jgi:hypothetical protein